MSKFNTATIAPNVTSPIRSETVPSGLTYEGAAGYARDAKSALHLLAVSNMVGEKTFYEDGRPRDDRYENLVRATTMEDPVWTAGLLSWLRSDANMRSAPIVGAAVFAHQRWISAQAGMSRQVVNSVLARPDEPGEIMACWTAMFGRKMSIAFKRGVGDGVRRLYHERSLLKYDKSSAAFRFGDVIELSHPRARTTWQGELFSHALDRRHDRDKPIDDALEVIRGRALLMAIIRPEMRRALLDTVTLASAGMTWEALAGWLQGPMDARAWGAIIPLMGYMGLLRNLRNFDEAGVSEAVAEAVAARLCDPEQVAKCRQFPFRFLSAYNAAPSLRWAYALDKALQLSLGNVPALPGRSLVLVDTSSSMTTVKLTAKSTMAPAAAAAVFGVALAAKGERVDLFGFANGTFRHQVQAGASVIKESARLIGRTGEVGHGTDIGGAVRLRYTGHDRVFVISDMQTMGRYTDDPFHAVPAHVPVYGFNLNGYQPAAFTTGARNRHEFGGLTDATFAQIPLLEAGQNATWPWLATPSA